MAMPGETIKSTDGRRISIDIVVAVATAFVVHEIVFFFPVPSIGSCLSLI